jgi:gluconate 2-dehydrogenase alpha chain
VNAKGATFINGIPEAQKAGLEIVTHSRVTEILVGGDGRASGVRYVRGGVEYDQPAKVVVLSTYTYENVRLLLLSKSKAFPDGLANNSGQVGKHYMSHNYVFANALMPKRLGGWGGPGAQRTSWDDHNGDNFDHTGLGFIGGGIGDIRHGERKPIGAARSTPPSVAGWGSDWKKWVAANVDKVASIGFQAECLPYEDAFIDLDPTETDPYGVPKARVTFDLHDQESKRYDYLYAKAEELAKEAGATEVWPSFGKLPVAVNSHAYGGTRMGTDADTSVVDGFGIAHEVPNLVVLGGSSFPSSSGYNPTLTIQALAWRTADHVVANFAKLST